MGTWWKGITRMTRKRLKLSQSSGAVAVNTLLPFTAFVTGFVQHLWFRQREEREVPFSENRLPSGYFGLDSSETNCMYRKAKLGWEAVDEDSWRVCDSGNGSLLLLQRFSTSSFTAAAPVAGRQKGTIFTSKIKVNELHANKLAFSGNSQQNRKKKAEPPNPAYHWLRREIHKHNH